MPLVMLSGYPCSGKTRFAQQLSEYLVGQGQSVLIVNEESLGISKAEGYKSSAAEKVTRSSLRSSVDHLLAGDTTVILDSLNYIKGYRYELYCVARSMRTPHCVCWVECDEKVSSRWNSERAAGETYDELILKDLRLRFEVPSEKNKWDCPLFKVNMTPIELAISNSSLSSAEPASSTSIEETVALEATVFSSFRKKGNSGGSNSNSTVVSRAASTSIPVDPLKSKAIYFSGSLVEVKAMSGAGVDECAAAIHKYLSGAPLPVPNSATARIARSDTDLLYELDRVSQQVTQTLMTHQTESLEGTPVVFSEYQRTMTLLRHVGLAELQRHRRQFVKVSAGLAGYKGSAEIGAGYIDYLSIQL